MRFLHHFRKLMIKDNRIGRYLLYAIGEILLVVIGILIALQINSWNSERQDRKKEKAYLMDIHENLVQDSIAIKNVLNFNKEKVLIVRDMMTLFSETLTNQQRGEIFSKNMMDFTSYEVFTPTKTSYNNLLNSESIDLISDKNIRMDLSDYYGYDYTGGVQERIMTQNRSIVDNTYYKFMTKEGVQNMLNITTNMPLESSLKIHEDQQFLAGLMGTTVIIDIQNNLLNTILKQNKQLREEINSYLN